MAKLSFAVLSVLAVGWAAAQSPSYVRGGSIGTADTPIPTKAWHQYRRLPMDEWEGKRVIFLPQPLQLRVFGYLDFTGGSGQFGMPTYEEAAGKIGKVVSVAKGDYPKVTIRMDESGKEYVGTIYIGELKNIAFLDEIDMARKEFIGKTLWVKSAEVLAYDEATGQFASVKTKKYSPVTVTDVAVGFSCDSPVRFILQTQHGAEGYLDVNLSGTNGGGSAEFDQFDKNFYMTDPRQQYPWTPKMWGAIENETVFVGMTKEQVRMSWGEPSSINQTVTGGGKTEQWIFSNHRYAYFQGSAMTSAQN